MMKEIVMEKTVITWSKGNDCRDFLLGTIPMFIPIFFLDENTLLHA